jgi:anti-repressor protein
MNDLMSMQFEGNEIRMVTIAMKPHWVAKDLAEALGYVWNGSARISHIPEKWRGVTSVVTPSGIQEMAVLSLEGVNFFLARSDKPRAIPIQEWISGEVLPSIQKTGSYSIPHIISPIAILSRRELAQMILDAEDEKEELRLELKEEREIGDFARKFLQAEGCLDMMIISHITKVGRTTLFKELRERSIIQKNSTLPMIGYTKKGYFKVIWTTFDINGKERTSHKTCVTPLGMKLIDDMGLSRVKLLDEFKNIISTNELTFTNSKAVTSNVINQKMEISSNDLSMDDIEIDLDVLLSEEV